MLQIRFSNETTHGPFNTIEKLDDRYDCNNGELHIPFTVVGEDCIIEEWVEPPPPEPETPATPE